MNVTTRPTLGSLDLRGLGTLDGSSNVTLGSGVFVNAATEWTGRGVDPKPVEGVEDERLALALARLGANVSGRKKTKPDGSSPD